MFTPDLGDVPRLFTALADRLPQWKEIRAENLAPIRPDLPCPRLSLFDDSEVPAGHIGRWRLRVEVQTARGDREFVLYEGLASPFLWDLGVEMARLMGALIVAGDPLPFRHRSVPCRTLQAFTERLEHYRHHYTTGLRARGIRRGLRSPAGHQQPSALVARSVRLIDRVLSVRGPHAVVAIDAVIKQQRVALFRGPVPCTLLRVYDLCRIYAVGLRDHRAILPADWFGVNCPAGDIDELRLRVEAVRAKAKNEHRSASAVYSN